MPGREEGRHHGVADLQPDDCVACGVDGAGGIDGICAYNDEHALALLAGARRLGLRVPDDIAVIGADDIAAAALSEPALTTVSADISALSRFVAKAVVRRLDGRPVPRRPGPETHTVVVRDSA